MLKKRLILVYDKLTQIILETNLIKPLATAATTVLDFQLQHFIFVGGSCINDWTR